jgi:hypothetical protein
MSLAIPIRDRNKASQAKCFGFCRYTPPRLRDFLSHAESADAKSSRICTFHSYLKPRIFNAPTAHRALFRLTHFVCADTKTGAIFRLKSKLCLFRLAPLVPPSSSASCVLLLSGPVCSPAAWQVTVFLTLLEFILRKPDSLSPLDCILTNCG